MPDPIGNFCVVQARRAEAHARLSYEHTLPPEHESAGVIRASGWVPATAPLGAINVHVCKHCGCVYAEVEK